MYCSEYFKLFEYFVWTSDEIKNVGEMLAKSAPKKRKNYHHWNTSSGNKCLWRWQFLYVGTWKKLLAWVKDNINKNFLTFKSLCNLQKIYTSFKKKHPNVNIGFSKFSILRTKWCVLAGSKMTDKNQKFLCLQRSSICCVASWCDGLGLDMQRPDQINFPLP